MSDGILTGASLKSGIAQMWQRSSAASLKSVKPAVKPAAKPLLSPLLSPRSTARLPNILKNGLNDRRERLPKFLSFVEFWGHFSKNVFRRRHFTSKQPWNMFKIVKLALKIVKLTAGAKKNNRKEIKRVKTNIFIYVFLVFWSFRKFEKDVNVPPLC